jgi:5-bromo-4-chloroindolyl phosphate hydrolysis protein
MVMGYVMVMVIVFILVVEFFIIPLIIPLSLLKKARMRTKTPFKKHTQA